MKKNIKNFAGIEYLTMINVPIKKTSHGEVINISLSELERLAALAILENRLPIRGIEVKLFRSVLGLSLAAFGEKLGYKDTTILNWEKKKTDRLSMVNEMAVRVLLSEHLGVHLFATIDNLKAGEEVKDLKVSAA